MAPKPHGQSGVERPTTPYLTRTFLCSCRIDNLKQQSSERSKFCQRSAKMAKIGAFSEIEERNGTSTMNKPTAVTARTESHSVVPMRHVRLHLVVTGIFPTAVTHQQPPSGMDAKHVLSLPSVTQSEPPGPVVHQTANETYKLASIDTSAIQTPRVRARDSAAIGSYPPDRPDRESMLPTAATTSTNESSAFASALQHSMLSLTQSHARAIVGANAIPDTATSPLAKPAVKTGPHDGLVHDSDDENETQVDFVATECTSDSIIAPSFTLTTAGEAATESTFEFASALPGSTVSENQDRVTLNADESTISDTAFYKQVQGVTRPVATADLKNCPHDFSNDFEKLGDYKDQAHWTNVLLDGSTISDTVFYKRVQGVTRPVVNADLKNCPHDFLVDTNDIEKRAAFKDQPRVTSNADESTISDVAFYKRVQGVTRPVATTDLKNCPHDFLVDTNDIEKQALVASATESIPGTMANMLNAERNVSMLDADLVDDGNGLPAGSLPVQMVDGVVSNDVPHPLTVQSTGMQRTFMAMVSFFLVSATIFSTVFCGGRGQCRRRSAGISELQLQVVEYIASITLMRHGLQGTREEGVLLQMMQENTLLLPPNTPYAQVIWRQRYALATLLSGLPNIKFHGDECTWKGVQCQFKESNYVVVGLNMSGLGMKAPCSVDLGLLYDLERVDFSQNALTGSLPESVVLWTSLQFFHARDNMFNGLLPASIAQWTNLVEFDLSVNQVTGSLPDSLRQWSRLAYFSASSNVLTGTIPDSVGEWADLQFYDVSFNALTGTLPETIGDWRNIEFCSFDENVMSGTIPQSLANWTKLEAAYFGNITEDPQFPVCGIGKPLLPENCASDTLCSCCNCNRRQLFV